LAPLGSVDYDPLLFDNLYLVFVLGIKHTFVAHPVNIPGDEVQERLMWPPLIVLLNIFSQRMPGNLLSWVRRVTVNLFLLDRAIPAFLSGVIGRPMGSAG
jgi:hypothetical protein